ncbi:hypothetical protein QBC42DRAFT_296972 [Cladorrhinum samala]|uniref:2EXR domain-containing protein n=1 Tax=Cladorrhinum samala TaxID=585594 RepID=A0AAV9HNK7_9PEZI|nr:hypothetical protein QBC42DRAFT_296972 [Cladorrhinum samala]
MTSFADPNDPTYNECRALGYTWLKPGKQCPHPSNTWFRDPRPSPPPLRPRSVILEDVFRNHAVFSRRHSAVLAHYKEPAPAAATASAAAAETPASFHLFPLLPAELREQIWTLAIPRRVLDVREVNHQGAYMRIGNAVLPVPRIASVCREARELVMRLGCRLSLSNGKRNIPAGFFVRGSDVAMYLPGWHAPRGAGRGKRAEGVVVVEPDKVAKVMRCEAAAVNWSGERSLMALAGEHRDPVTQYLPGSAAQGAQGAGSWLKGWIDLKAAESRDLETVFVFYRGRYTEISLLVRKEFTEEQAAAAAANGVADGEDGVEVQLLVDLYDDSRLAELSSLETLFVDGRKESEKPRYAAPEARNPGLCLNCERVQWERYVKPLAVRQWLQLYEDELNEGELAAAFAVGSQLPYDPEHVWVKEKLRVMPELRPAILVHLQVAEEARLQDHSNSEWADYHSRVLTLR